MASHTARVKELSEQTFRLLRIFGTFNSAAKDYFARPRSVRILSLPVLVHQFGFRLLERYQRTSSKKSYRAKPFIARV